MVYCYNCGQKLPKDACFCPRCGAKALKGVDESFPSPSDEAREAFAKMSAELEKAFTVAAKEIHMAFQTARNSVQQSLRLEPAVCSNCGQKNPSGSTFCSKCGNKLKPDVAEKHQEKT